MENFLARYRNVTVLLVLMMGQLIALATQVRRPNNVVTGESMSVFRFWVIETLVPIEKAIASVGSGVRNGWKGYIDLRDVRRQNQDLQAQLDRLRLEEVGLAEDAGQARRLQTLLAFKEKFISGTVAAQVIGTSGSEHSHVLYIDKGSNDGLKADMAVITPKGIVGKISKVLPGTSQVLEINDATAGAGVMLERTRLRGVLHGTSSGIPEILHIMADEKIEPGEPVVSSGGDQIYPRGLPIGTVFNTAPDPEGGPFMLVRVKPSANLDRVEEVLVITKVVDKEPEQQETTTSLRAADILAQRLPTIVPKPPASGNSEPPPTSALYRKTTSAEPPPTSVLYGRKPSTPAATAASAKPASGAGTTTASPAPKKVAKPVDNEAATSGETTGAPATAPTAAAKKAKPQAPPVPQAAQEIPQ